MTEAPSDVKIRGNSRTVYPPPPDPATNVGRLADPGPAVEWRVLRECRVPRRGDASVARTPAPRLTPRASRLWLQDLLDRDEGVAVLAEGLDETGEGVLIGAVGADVHQDDAPGVLVAVAVLDDLGGGGLPPAEGVAGPHDRQVIAGGVDVLGDLLVLGAVAVG